MACRIHETDLFILDGGELPKDTGAIIWLEPVVLAKLLGKPVIFYGISAGPINTRNKRLLTRLIVNRVNLIMVRDEDSKSRLETFGVSRKIHVTADSSFDLSPIASKEARQILAQENVTRESRSLVGICIRPWFLHTLEERSRFVEFKTIMVRLADRLITELGAQVVFTPFQYREDVILAMDVKNRMQHQDECKVLMGEYTPQELIGIIGQMDFFVGMRLHSLIFATKMLVPFVAISYAPKVRGFMKMLGQEKWMCDIEHMNIENLRTKCLNEIWGKISEAWLVKDQIRMDLESRLEPMLKRATLNRVLASKFISA